jgi:amidase
MTKVSVHQKGLTGDLDATAIAEHLRRKDFSVEEVLRSVEEKMHHANPQINAVAAFDFQLNKQSFKQGGAFTGVPLFVKDLIHAKGFPTRFGSKAFSDIALSKNSKGVDQMESMGFITVGKSTTSEFGYTSGCETLAHGDTRNPIHTDYTTGGSSGGAAALVAAGVVPLAHAMDGGGSIRIPASNCGLIGLKPSKGRILGSLSAGLPVDVTCDGVVTRTVRDTANFFYGAEKYVRLKKLPPIGNITGPNTRRLRIAVSIETFEQQMPHPDVAKVIEQTAKALEALEHQVEFIRNPFPQSFAEDFHNYFAFMAFLGNSFGKVSFHRSFDKRHTLPATKGLAGHFKNTGLNVISSIKRLRKEYPAIYTALFQNYDVILSPVTAQPVPAIGHFGSKVDYDIIIERLIDYIKYTPLHNTTGAPSISLPMGQCNKGLPVGAMFSAAVGDEKTLLELAFEIESAGMLLRHEDYQTRLNA